MFATDRDLLVLEPRLFFDIAWTAQKRIDATGGSIDAAGTTLTLAGVDFAAQGVGPGSVVLAAGAPLEVIARVSPTQLSVSRLREGASASAVPATPGSALKIVVQTFAPQLALVHDQVLRMLGIEPGAPAAPGTPTEAAITNPRSLALLEALGALHLIFAAAAALVGPDSPHWIKAQMYRQRMATERQRARAELDLDADGLPDAARRPSVLLLSRA